jgi:hypothetical protein
MKISTTVAAAVIGPVLAAGALAVASTVNAEAESVHRSSRLLAGLAA